MPKTKVLNAARVVDILDMDDATDVVARATANNNLEVLHRFAAKEVTSGGRVKAMTDVFDQFGNVRDNTARNISFNDTNLLSGKKTLQELLEKLNYDIGRGMHGAGTGVVSRLAIFIAEIPPVSPLDGDLWFNPTLGELSSWYVDIDSAAWVVVAGDGQGAPGDAGPGGPTGPVGSTGPAGIGAASMDQGRY